MIPRQGLSVIVLGIEANGIGEQPAIITRTWSKRDTKDGAIAVNLTVFPDTCMPMLRSSVMLFETRREASAYRGGNLHAIAAFWPDNGSDDSPDAAVAGAPAQLAA